MSVPVVLWIVSLLAPVTDILAQPLPSYIEIDFAPLPRNGDGKYKLQFTLWTTDKDITLSEPTQFDRKEGDPAANCETIALLLNTNRWKAEVVNKTKLRVYGRMFNDKLIPVTKGAVESSDLQPEELPKVKNPGEQGVEAAHRRRKRSQSRDAVPKPQQLGAVMLFLLAGLSLCASYGVEHTNVAARADERPYVEFDLNPLPCDENRMWELVIKVSTERLIFDDKLNVNGRTDRFSNCDGFVLRLREVGFEAEVIDKSKVRVYGAKTDGKFYPATKGKVETEGLSKDEVPKVTAIGKKG